MIDVLSTGTYAILTGRNPDIHKHVCEYLVSKGVDFKFKHYDINNHSAYVRIKNGRIEGWGDYIETLYKDYPTFKPVKWCDVQRNIVPQHLFDFD